MLWAEIIMQKVAWSAAWLTLRLNFYTPPLTNLKPHWQIFSSYSSKWECWVPECQPPSHWDLQPVQQRLNSRRMSSLRWVTTFKTLLVQQLQDVLNGIFSNCTLANAQNKQNPNKLLQYGVRIHNVLTSFQRLVLTQMWFPVKQNLIANHKHICRLILSLMQHFIRGGNKIRPLEFQRNF